MIPPLHSIGRVAGKHGFSGEISIVLHKGSKPDMIKKGNFLFIEFDGKGVPFLIEQYKAQSGVVKLCDVTNIEESAALEGRSIWIVGEAQSEVQEWDVIGFSLLANNNNLGKIKGVEIFPAGPMLQIEGTDAEILIPWVEDWIADVNVKKKCITMDLPEGLLDI
jgi:16S rRNA processing protein RimM